MQNDHTIPTDSYNILPIRTGYEQILAHRATSTFASTAKQNGKVVHLDDSVLVVEYDDGSQDKIELGRKFGIDGDLVIPHDIIPFVKLGDTFDKNTVLTYNPGFFKPDPINPKNVAYKAGKMMKVALLENEYTIEDSSVLTREAAAGIAVRTSKVRNIVVNFDQVIHRLVKPGTKVDVNDILCIMEDSITADTDVFDEASIEALSKLARQTPKAKYSGVVEKVEIFYNGDIEDMSESLLKLANMSNAVMYRNSKNLTGKGYTGLVDETYRVDGNPLMVDTAVINIYITKEFNISVGDKGVFANQLKTTFGEILSYTPVAKDGTKLDAIFGGKSVYARIVTSPMAVGTGNTLLSIFSKKMAKMYFEEE